MPRVRRSTALPILLTLALVAGACGPEAEDIGAEGGGGVAERTTQGDGAAARPLEAEGPAPEGSLSTAGPSQAGTVHVSLRDLQIEMPTVLPAGSVTFQVHNSGSHEHGFGIEGPGLERALPQTLETGESGQLSVDLAVGTYRAYCPVEDHAERGMELEITVEEREGEGPPAP